MCVWLKYSVEIVVPQHTRKNERAPNRCANVNRNEDNSFRTEKYDFSAWCAPPFGRRLAVIFRHGIFDWCVRGHRIAFTCSLTSLPHCAPCIQLYIPIRFELLAQHSDFNFIQFVFTIYYLSVYCVLTFRGVSR